MSIHVGLDESLVTVAPSLDDIEPLLVIRTRYRSLGEQGVNGLVHKVQGKSGKKCLKALTPTVPEEDRAIYETMIPASCSEGFSEYETQTVYLAGGPNRTGNVFFATDRRVRLAARWYGTNNRYVELRIQVSPGAEIIANRGMASFQEEDAQCNFLGQIKRGGWAEVHIDNITHVGMSLHLHTPFEDFSAVAEKRELNPAADPTTRWAMLLSDDKFD